MEPIHYILHEGIIVIQSCWIFEIPTEKNNSRGILKNSYTNIFFFFILFYFILEEKNIPQDKSLKNKFTFFKIIFIFFSKEWCIK